MRTCCPPFFLLPPPSADLHFDGPFSLPLPCISSLIQQDRLGPVTIYNLLLAGAVEFAFLGPDEAIAGSASSCMLPVDIPHGAFVYRCVYAPRATMALDIILDVSLSVHRVLILFLLDFDK
jgi:hypothetical protein